MDEQYDVAALMKALMGAPSEEGRRLARNQALLQAGFTMMSTPGSFAQALGAGGKAGSEAYQQEANRQQDERAKRLQLGMQLEDYMRKREVRDLAPKFYRNPLETALEEGAKSGSVGPTLENAQRLENSKPSFDYAGYIDALAQYDPAQAAQLSGAMAKETPFNKIDPKDYTPESVAAFARSRNHADLVPVRKMEVVQGQVFDPYGAKAGTVLDMVDPNQPFGIRGGQVVPNEGYQRYSITKASAGAPRTQVTNVSQMESEQSKAYGKGLGEVRMAINQASFNAPSRLRDLARMEELLEGLETGKLTPAMTQVSSALKSLGIDLDPNVGAKEAAESLSLKMAGELRQPGTGPMTDKDFDNFMKQVPSLSKTQEGRRQIIATQRAALKRDIEIGKMARDYAAKNGNVIDDAFFDTVADYYAKNPVWTPAAPMPGSSAETDALVDMYLKPGR